MIQKIPGLLLLTEKLVVKVEMTLAHDILQGRDIPMAMDWATVYGKARCLCTQGLSMGTAHIDSWKTHLRFQNEN